MQKLLAIGDHFITASLMRASIKARVGDGIELSDDPVLHARRKAYSVSAYRRLGTG